MASPCLAFGKGVWRYLWRHFYRGYHVYPAPISCNCVPASGVAPHPHIIYHLTSVLNLVQCLHMSSRIIHAVLFIVISVLIVVMYSSCAGPYPCLQVYPSLITANSSCPSILNLVLLGGRLLLDEVVSWVILEVEGVACYVLVNTLASGKSPHTGRNKVGEGVNSVHDDDAFR